MKIYKLTNPNNLLKKTDIKDLIINFIKFYTEELMAWAQTRGHGCNRVGLALNGVAIGLQFFFGVGCNCPIGPTLSMNQYPPKQCLWWQVLEY